MYSWVVVLFEGDEHMKLFCHLHLIQIVLQKFSFYYDWLRNEKYL